jgi:hypothetical protein
LVGVVYQAEQGGNRPFQGPLPRSSSGLVIRSSFGLVDCCAAPFYSVNTRRTIEGHRIPSCYPTPVASLVMGPDVSTGTGEKTLARGDDA